MACLQTNNVSTKILSECLDYTDIFLSNLTIEVPKHNIINNYAIELAKSKQFLYKLIYRLGLGELNTLKI